MGENIFESVIILFYVFIDFRLQWSRLDQERDCIRLDVFLPDKAVIIARNIRLSGLGPV